MKIGMCMLLWTTHVGPEHEATMRDIKATGFDGGNRLNQERTKEIQAGN